MAARSTRAARLRGWIGRHRLLVFGGLGVLVAVWIAVSAVQVLSARSELNQAVDDLKAAQLKLKPGEIVNGGGGHALAVAQHGFEDAYAKIDSPFVAPFRLLPVLGRQLNAVRSMSASAATTTRVANEARVDMRKVLVEGWDERGQRVNSMLAFEKIAGHALKEMKGLDLGPSDALIGPVADARREFQEKLDEARDLIGKAKSVAGGMAVFLQGPTRYLVLAANNAEMRAGSGMILNAGIITAENGHMIQVSMDPTAELLLPPGAVEVPAGDYRDRWGWLLPNEEWRNLASTPNFASTASLARDMWKARTGETVDGVLLLDPFALQALLATSGPVTVDDVELNGDNVLDYIFHDQYQGLDASGANDARRDRLGEIADAAVQNFDEGTFELSNLLDNLQSVVDGRHALAWSANPAENRAWRAAGVSGELSGKSLMVSVMNFGGNKLDPFLDVDSVLTEQPGASGTDVRVEITVHNGAPVDDAGYVLGRFQGNYPGILAVNLPGYATAPKLEGVDDLVAAGPDGRTTVLAGKFVVDRDQTKTFVVTFTMPPGKTVIEVAPSARYPGVNWTFGTEQWISGATHHVEW